MSLLKTLLTKTPVITPVGVSAGTLFTWGQATSGMGGDGTITNRSSPVQIGSSSWIIVSQGPSHTAAIRNDGKLFTWGAGTNGMLGDSTTVNKSSPVQIGNSSWTTVAVSDQRTLAIRSDGALFSWGKNDRGHLGLGDFVHRSSPVQIGTSSWSSLPSGNAVGNIISSAIRSDGALFVWGDNTLGYFGNNSVISANSPVQLGVGESWNTISIGASHVLALKDGKIYAWGDNGTNGVFGNNDVTSTPNQPWMSWTMVARSREDKTCSYGIKGDGSLWAWGLNNFGAIGNNTVGAVLYSSPVQIGTSSWTTVATVPDPYVLLDPAAGAQKTFAIRSDGTLWAWGTNDNNVLTDTPAAGYLGIGSSAHRSSPTQVGTSSWTTVSTWKITAAIRSDGRLFTWGSEDESTFNQGNNNGALFGQNISIIGGLTSPTQVGTSSWTTVSVGYRHVAAIRSDGRLFTWGNGDSGKLGDTSTAHRSSPVQVGTSSWTSVSCGHNFTAAIRSDGRLFTWGNGDSGELGTWQTPTFKTIAYAPSAAVAIRSDGTLWAWGPGGLDGYHRSNPVQIGSSSWTQVVVTKDILTAYAAIRSDGALFTWGVNLNGSLGDGTSTSRSSPVQIGTSSWTSVKAGASHFGAIRSDGNLFMWGSNFYGELGTNDSIHRSSPTQVTTMSSVSVLTLGAGFTGVIKAGALFAWGSNVYGQMGDNKLIGAVSGSWTQISVGPSHMAAIKSTGGLFTWGTNGSGQLGLNNTMNTSSPSQVGSGSWSNVSAGANHTLAVASNGTLWAWGNNEFGQLGNNISGAFNGRSSPVQIGSNSNWSRAVASNTTDSSPIQVQSFGITTNGNLFGWGRNDYGTLGDLTSTHRSSPVQIGSSLSWNNVASANGTTLAITSSSVYSWGNGADGVLGTNTTLHRSSPVQIGTIAANTSNKQTISVGFNSAAIINSSGTLFTWGTNSSGQLGDSTITHRSSPVQIGVTGGWTSIQMGRSNAVALKSSTMWGWGGTGGPTFGQYFMPMSSPVQLGSSIFSTSPNGNISSGDLTAAGISNGTLLISGDNTYGQAGSGLGGGHIGTPGGLTAGAPGWVALSSPVQIGSSLTWSDIAAGKNWFIGAALNGANTNLFSWGENNSGQLGHNNTTPLSSPTQIGATNHTSPKVFAGENHAGYYSQALGTFTFGFNSSGQLGDGSSVSKSSPTLIRSASESWAFLGLGEVNSAAKVNLNGIDGLAFVWGSNFRGLLGNNKNDDTNFGANATSSPITLNAGGYQSSSPVQIGTSSWTMVKCSSGELQFITQHSAFGWMAGITSNGSLFAWGNNTYSQLGTGDNISRSSPTLISSSSWVFVSAAAGEGAAIYSRDLTTYQRNALYTWGGNLGNNTTNTATTPTLVGKYFYSRISPVMITNPIGSFTQIHASASRSAAIYSTGALYTWGNNGSGELGDNTRLHRSMPTQIGLSSWVFVASLQNSTVAIDQNRGLYTWGGNNNGALGSNVIFTIFRSSPVQVGTSSWITVNANNFSVKAIKY